MSRYIYRRYLTWILIFLMGTLALSAWAQGKKWALLVGVEEYESQDIAHLDFAVKDVSAVAGVLHDRLGYQTRLMTSAIAGAGDPNRPTNLNVFKVLDRLSQDIKEEDTFLFYFSGHGFNKDGQNFLGTANTDPASIETLQLSAIPLATLQKKVAKLKAHQVIFIMDACRNDPEKGKGEGDNKLTSDFSKSLVLAARAQGALAGGSAVLFACSEGERAFEDPARKQSAFTYYLLEALQGKATVGNALTMTDVADYVQKQVAEWARDHNKKQTPELKTEGAARILLADRIIGAAAPVEAAPIKLLNTQAALTITSDPPGADVIIDGKTIGKTPFTLTQDLGLDEKKTVRIGLSRSGYKALAFDVDLTRGKPLAAPSIVLSPLAAPAGIAATPGIAASKFRKNSKDNADMVFIPAGEFPMGSDRYADEKLVHRVTLDEYYIYRTPVTVAQYKLFIASDYAKSKGITMPRYPSFNLGWKNEDHPIVNVSYNEAQAYCEWAGVKLPTEAQRNVSRP